MKASNKKPEIKNKNKYDKKIKIKTNFNETIEALLKPPAGKKKK